MANHESDHNKVDTLAESVGAQASQAVELLRHESRLHQEQTAQTSLLGGALAGATEFFHHGSASGRKVDDLRRDIEADLQKGQTGEADKLAAGASALVRADQAALARRATITEVGSGVAQAAGLFMAGRKGFALAAGVAALDAIKPASHESFSAEAVDVALGIGRSVGLKAAYLGAGKLNLGMASTAVGLGVGSRFADLALNRNTYLDGSSGQYSAALGARRVFDGTTDKTALLSDVVSMALAKGALGAINRSTDGALLNSRVWSTLAVGGVFGMTKGGVDETIRQHKQGRFDPEQLLLKTALSGAISMAGAALGGLPSIRSARPNFAGSEAREYQISGANLNQPIAEILAGSRNASILTRVREVKADGKLGPEQNLLVQHGGKGIPINETLAAKADIVASCDPASLPLALRERHIMPTVENTLWMTQSPGGKLTFRAQLAEALKKSTRIADYALDIAHPALPIRGGLSTTVALGEQSVSSLLRAPGTRDLLREKNTHDLGLYSEVLKDFKTPALHVIDGGADSVVVRLADNNVLKITHLDWNPEWGKRSYEDAQGNRFRFDARILGEPRTIKRPDGQATFYVQEPAITPVSAADMDTFIARLERDRRYLYTDRDVHQLGYTDMGNGRRGLVLLDYDAVQTPQAVQEEHRRLREARRYAD
ncbi:MAG: hypothetical protein KGS72_16190 [Cyanobacteria bacterium REEB67]|nr:hypothetical protein [Cyanobacteria bacterium REEB67]